MIATLLRIGRINLRRDRAAQTMVFAVPIAFFSIFAIIFGGQRESTRAPRFPIAIVDEQRSEASRDLIAALRRDSSLTVRESVAVAGAGNENRRAARPLDRGAATRMVHDGELPVALILPRGWEPSRPGASGGGARAEVLSDPSDPLARGAVIGMLQHAGARRWMRSFAPSSRADSADDQFGLPVPATIQDVAGPQRRDSRRMIAYYAAAIAVMFLLFSSSSGGGSLLDEQDSSTLERLLNTDLGMTRVLAGKWLHLTLLGMLQVTVMFTWGMIAFRLDLLRHLPGFVIMTACAAAAAAAFGLVLATACRSRQQLSGFSYIIILSMSAVGGSMFPRFLMTPAMQKAGLFTFNAWALDGYLKVFWYEKPLSSLAPQVSVLIGLTAVFLVIARALARRWETV